MSRMNKIIIYSTILIFLVSLVHGSGESEVFEGRKKKTVINADYYVAANGIDSSSCTVASPCFVILFFLFSDLLWQSNHKI